MVAGSDLEDNISNDRFVFVTPALVIVTYVFNVLSTCPSIHAGIHTRSLEYIRNASGSAVAHGSVVECLTRDGGVAGWSLTGVSALCP